MAVRYDANGENYTSSQGLGLAAAYSVTCWAKLEVDRAATSCIWQVDNGVGASYLRVNAFNGTQLAFQTDTGLWNGVAGQTMVVGTWYFIGFSATANPGQARTAIRAADSTTFTGGTSSQANDSFVAGTLRLGSGRNAGEWINGSIAAFKVWNAALTTDELQNESFSYRPQRSVGFYSWFPLLQPDTLDYSGNGRHMGGGTGSALADGPPIAWGRGRTNIVHVIPPAVTPITLADAGSASDALSVAVTPSLADAGSAANALTASATAVLAESASAAQALTVTATTSLADAGSGADTVSAGVPKSVADAGAAAESFAANATVPLAQAASAAESLTANVTLALADAASGADSIAAGLLLAKTLTDAGSATDALSAVISRDITGAGAPYMAWAADAPEVRWAAGQPYSPWAADAPTSAWSATPPSTRYSAGPPALEEV